MSLLPQFSDGSAVDLRVICDCCGKQTQTIRTTNTDALKVHVDQRRNALDAVSYKDKKGTEARKRALEEATIAFKVAVQRRNEQIKDLLDCEDLTRRKKGKHLCKCCISLVKRYFQLFLFELGEPNRRKSK